MQGKSIYKVPNGKLLKIFLDYNSKKKSISKISITGDFFAHPEEAIDMMETELKNTVLDKEILLNKVNSIIKRHSIQFIGLNAEGLAQGIMMCIK